MPVHGSGPLGSITEFGAAVVTVEGGVDRVHYSVTVPANAPSFPRLVSVAVLIVGDACFRET